MKFAVIQTGGKQYIVKPGDTIKVEKLKKPENGDDFYFDKVLLVAEDDKISIGKPYLENAKVGAIWEKNGRKKKITIIKYKSKTRYRKKMGHRQQYTEVLIKDIVSR